MFTPDIGYRIPDFFPILGPGSGFAKLIEKKKARESTLVTIRGLHFKGSIEKAIFLTILGPGRGIFSAPLLLLPASNALVSINKVVILKLTDRGDIPLLLCLEDKSS
jgi:hypothetical protein